MKFCATLDDLHAAWVGGLDYGLANPDPAVVDARARELLLRQAGTWVAQSDIIAREKGPAWAQLIADAGEVA